MNPVEREDPAMDPREVKVLLLDRAERVHVHGDFTASAVSGARRVRTRRLALGTVAAALAVAVPFGVALRGSVAEHANPAASSPRVSATALPAPTLITAVVHGGAPDAPMPLPYVQAGQLHLNGTTVPLKLGPDARLLMFATLSTGGVAYQAAGPDPAAPEFDAGPLTFLDARGQLIAQYDVLHTDTDGPGNVVVGVEPDGERLVLDASGNLIRRLAPVEEPTVKQVASLGGDLVAGLAGVETGLWVGSLTTGRSALVAGWYRVADVRHWAIGLALHEGRSLVVQGLFHPTSRDFRCKVLVNYVTGEELRSWCDDRHPLGFSPDGTWMYGEYLNSANVWVERTDDGGRLLEIRAEAGTTFAGEFPAPTADGTELVVVMTEADGRTVPVSCTVLTGQCRVVSDGLDDPSTERLSLPDNWGRQDISKSQPDATMP